MKIEIGTNEAGQRLDKFLRKYFKDVPLSAIFKALRKGDIRVNGTKKKENYALELGVTCEGVIDSLKKMGYNYKSKSDILDDEAIIMLDNELSKVEENNLTEELADKFELEDRAEEAALAYNIELDEQVKVKEKFKKKVFLSGLVCKLLLE